ncbi:MAG: hypothetical protein AB4041_16110 [Microcystaceae cyanobacterium]
MSSIRDYRQDIAISAAASDARKATSQAEDMASLINHLENKIDLLSLRCQAMWEVLRDNTQLSDEVIKEKITAFYEKHGVVRGKIAKKAEKCPNCNRPMDKRTKKCLYCGHSVVLSDPLISL